jgi:hypothetical protein
MKHTKTRQVRVLLQLGFGSFKKIPHNLFFKNRIPALRRSLLSRPHPSWLVFRPRPSHTLIRQHRDHQFKEISMKRTALAGLFISAAMLASPVFAADNNLCTSKLQELKSKVNSLPASSSNTAMEVKRLMSSAEASQASGDDKKCVTEATQASALADKQRTEHNP